MQDLYLKLMKHGVTLRVEPFYDFDVSQAIIFRFQKGDRARSVSFSSTILERDMAYVVRCLNIELDLLLQDFAKNS